MADGIYNFGEPREYVELNQRLLQQELKREVPAAYALKDILTSSFKALLFFDYGFEIPDRLLRCDNCRRIYTQDWKTLAEPDRTSDDAPYGTTFSDIEIDFYYPHDGGEQEHVKKRIELSGSECRACLRENNLLMRRSWRMVRKRPEEWHSNGLSKIFDEHGDFIGVPEERLLPVPLHVYSQGLSAPATEKA